MSEQTVVIEAGRHDRERGSAGSASWMRRWTACLRIVAIALLFSAFGVQSPARAAPLVSTGLSEQGGFARIVFSWPGGVPGHTEAVQAGVLVVKFDRPFTIDLNEFLRQMPNTIAMARQDKDGQTLRLALKFDYWINARTAENSLYVDLLPSTWTGAPPPLPADVLARVAAAEAARKAAAEEARLLKARGVADPAAPAPALSVRVARHDGITRLVFDWNQPVLYSLVRQKGLATITFDRAAKVALAQVRVDPPPYLESISSVERNGKLSIFMKVKPGIVVSDFREDLGVVIDLKPAQPAFTDTSEPDDSTKTATKSPPPPAEGTAAPAHAPKPILPPSVAAAAAVPTPSPEPQPVSAAAPADAESGPLTVTAHVVDGRTVLEFPWTQPTGAAVFERADTLWIVFDRRAKLDITAIDPAVLKIFGTPASVDLDKGVALAIPLLSSRLLVGAAESGTAWRISLADSLTNTGRPLSLARSWSDTGEGIVTIDLKGARNILQVKDPVVRDTLLVATARTPLQSVQTPRRFVDFKALRTVQGVAIERIADDVNVAAAPDAVVVTRREGLTLSADNESTSESLSGGMAGASPTVIDFQKWRGAGNFIEGKKFHEGRIISGEAIDRAQARVAYARFLLAHGLGPEALTQLGMAVAADPKLENDTVFHALRGVGEVLAHLYPRAVADLSISSLAMDSNVAAWRGMARAALGQMDVARKDFDMAGRAIDTLDPVWAQQAHLKAAEASLAVNDTTGAQTHLARLSSAVEDPSVRAEASMLQAELLDALKRPEEAITLYDKAIAEGKGMVAVRSRFEKALLLNRIGKLDNTRLIAELDRLRMTWRGDDLERRILAKLGELQLAKGDIVDALRVMRVATTNFPDNDEAHAMAARMPDIFADYFIGASVSEMPGVQALAFYYDFQDLTPIGQKGDELIRHLAERLVAVDLLPQAEVLLRYQIEQRLHGGVAKAQVAARLAGIYLLDRQPKEALQIIRTTAQNQLPDELDHQRRLIEARALGSLKQYDLSLDLLSEMTGPLADGLRADVLWEAQRWDEAGKAAETLAAGLDVGAAGKPLTDEARYQIMRGAIAYSLADDEEGLARLRSRFGERMAQTSDASGFAVVSDPIERSGVAFRNLVSRIAAANVMQRFVASLKNDEAAPVAVN